MGCTTACCRGYTTVDSTARTGCVTIKRRSSTIKNTDSALNSKNLDNAEAPCLKKGGGDRSSVPKGIERFLRQQAAGRWVIRW